MERARRPAEGQLLDAAERLLIREGQAALTTRRVAEEAGVNHGLVHYYFGSMAQLALMTAQRATARLIFRQRQMYDGPGTFLEKWRTAMAFLDEDLRAGYPKLMFELSALGWNDEALAAAIADMDAQWREVLRGAVRNALVEYGLDERDYPVEALVTLIATFNLGIEGERLIGVSTGHSELLDWIDGWLAALDKRSHDLKQGQRGRRGSPRARA